MAELVTTSGEVGTSGAEGNKELQVDLNQVEDFSTAGTNDVIREDQIDIDMEKASGSGGSPVRPPAEGSGPEDSLNEERQMNPADAIAAAREAANSARGAISSCQKTMKKAKRAMGVSRDTINYALTQASGAARVSEADRHRSFAHKCRHANKRVSDALYKAESVIDLVTATADNADHSATRLAANLKTEAARNEQQGASSAAEAVPNEQQGASSAAEAVPNEQQGASSAVEAVPNEQQGASSAAEAVPNEQQGATSATEVVRNKQLAISAAENAKKNEVEAYKSKYLVLKATRKLWEDLESRETNRTESTDNVSCGCRYRVTSTYVSLAIVFVLGCIFISLPSFLKISSENNDRLKGTGGLFVATTMAFGAYKLLRFAYKLKIAAVRNRRQTIIANIERELRTLEDYFENNDVSPPPSDDSESEL